MFSRFGRVIPLFWLALVLFWTAPARAQTPTPTPAPVQMALSSPFARTPKPLTLMGRAGKWVPIAVTLSNTGDPVVGQLQLQLAATAAGNMEYASNTVTTTVDLPTNSRKVVWLYARLDRPYIDSLDVSLSGRGINVPTQRVPLANPQDEQREVLVVSDTDIGLNDTLRSLRSQALFKNGKAPQNNVGAGQNPVVPFSFGRADVPDRWIGLESADLVVLGDFAHAALSPQQLDALRGYVMGGGTLVVMGGANAARLSASPLRDLWPLNPTTSVSASPSEVAGLVSKYVENPQNGADRLGGSPVVVTRGTLSSDAHLEDGTPANALFARRDVGAGRILYLSYDPSQPPFKGWEGQKRLWAELLGRAARINTLETVDPEFKGIFGAASGYPSSGAYGYGPGGYGYGQPAPLSATGQLLDVVSRAPQLRMPPVSRIAWFLALYVFFLVPLNYAVLRIIDRRELAWITIPVIVVAFSVWAYTEALSIRGRAILTRQMDIVQSTLGSKTGRVDTLFWLFSPRTTTYNISSGGQTAALDDFANQAGGQQGAFTIEQPLDGSGFRLPDAPLRIWTDRAFASQSLGDLGRGVSFSGGALRNSTGVDLQGAVWVQDGRVASLGTLRNGASVPIPKPTGQKYSADMAGAVVRASDLRAVFDDSSRSSGIPTAALSAALGEGFGKFGTTPMLLAWGKRSIAPISIGLDAAQSREMTLFVFRAPALPKTFAAREATVQRVAFEPFTPAAPLTGGYGGSRFAPRNLPPQAGYALFDCSDVPDSPNLSLSARGTGAVDEEDFPPTGRYFAPGRGNFPPARGRKLLPAPKNSVQVEAWNPHSAKWQRISGQPHFDPSPAGGWNFQSRLPPELVSRPSNSLRVRVRLQNASAQVSSLTVER